MFLGKKDKLTITWFNKCAHRLTYSLLKNLLLIIQRSVFVG